MNSDWDTLIAYLKSKPSDYIFTTKEINENLRSLNSGTRWSYISLLRKAAFIKKPFRAHWQLSEPLPEGLTLSSVHHFLNGDNLSFIESVSKKREKDTLSVPYNKERQQILSTLVQEGLKLLELVKIANCPLYRIDISYLPSQINLWKAELKEIKNPTKKWMEKKLNETLCNVQ